MKQCPKCNAELADDAKFCNQCGTSQDGITYCVNCGKPLVGNATFCVHCGATVRRHSSRWVWLLVLAIIATAAISVLVMKLIDQRQPAAALTALQSELQHPDTQFVAQSPVVSRQAEPDTLQQVAPPPPARPVAVTPPPAPAGQTYTPTYDDDLGRTRPATDNSYAEHEAPILEEVVAEPAPTRVYVATTNIFVRTGPGTQYEPKYSPYSDMKSNYTNGVVLCKGSRVMVLSDVTDGFVRVRQLTPENDRDEWEEGWVGYRLLTPDN